MPSSPSPLPTVSRRRVLTTGAALTLLAVAVPACAPVAPSEPDPLAAPLASARHDAALARELAEGATGPTTAALEQIAAQREAHAQALETEINRVAGATPGTTTPVDTGAPSAATLDQLSAALQDSAQRATALATGLSGYRAGLLGSIAAACTVDYTVTLAQGGRR